MAFTVFLMFTITGLVKGLPVMTAFGLVYGVYCLLAAFWRMRTAWYTWTNG